VSSRSIAVVHAGLSEPSSTRLLADRLVSAIERLVRGSGLETDFEIIELRDYAQDLTNHLLTGFPSPRLRAAIDAVIAKDGLIAVTPIYNASYSGLFKMFFDVLERDSLAGKPVSIAATGGTPRHSLALEHSLRPMFAYLDAATIPTAVYAATEDWGQQTDESEPALVDRIERAAREFADAVARRVPAVPADPFETPVPFEDLLRSPTAGPSDPRRTG
jgi:FMN reductase